MRIGVHIDAFFGSGKLLVCRKAFITFSIGLEPAIVSSVEYCVGHLATCGRRLATRDDGVDFQRLCPVAGNIYGSWSPWHTSCVDISPTHVVVIHARQR